MCWGVFKFRLVKEVSTFTHEELTAAGFFPATVSQQLEAYAAAATAAVSLAWNRR